LYAVNGGLTGAFFFAEELFCGFAVFVAGVAAFVDFFAADLREAVFFDALFFIEGLFFLGAVVFLAPGDFLSAAFGLLTAPFLPAGAVFLTARGFFPAVEDFGEVFDGDLAFVCAGDFFLGELFGEELFFPDVRFFAAPVAAFFFPEGFVIFLAGLETLSFLRILNILRLLLCLD
jgi:hypothetical protein